MSDQIKDIVIPILQNLQGELAVVKTDVSSVRHDISVLKENTGKIDQRLRSVETHMSGFMSSSRYQETEIDESRGRVEALEDHNKSES